MNPSTSNSLENMLTTITPFATIFFIIGAIAFGVGIAYVIRLWLVQTATFQIQQDVESIKNHMLGYDAQYAQRVIPQTVESGYVEPIPEKKKIELKAPRKVFVWISILVPVLLICLVVLLNIF